MRLRKPFLSQSQNYAALEDLKMEFLKTKTYIAPEDINIAPKDLAALFFRNVLGRKSLQLLWKMLPDSQKKPSDLWQSCTANACWKSVPISMSSTIGLKFLQTIVYRQKV